MKLRGENLITFILLVLFFFSIPTQGSLSIAEFQTAFAQTKSLTVTVLESPKKSFFTRIIDWVKGDSAPPPENGVENPPSPTENPPPKEGIVGTFTKKIGSFFGVKEESPEEIAKTQDPNQNGIPPVGGSEEPIVDLLTCPSGNLILEPLAPAIRQSWWPAFLKLVETSAYDLTSTPKNKLDTLQQTSPKTGFEYRMNAGTLPRPGDFGWKWDESMQKPVPLTYHCPVFTGIGEGSSGYGSLQRDGNRVLHSAPSRLFSSNYVVTATSQSDGTRMIDMDPTKVNIFKGTQSGGHGTPSHGGRAASDYEVCPAGGECITGRIRKIHCSCKLDPHRYPYDDNSVLLSADDPCGVAKLLNPQHPKWVDAGSGGAALNLIQYPAGVLSQVKDAQGNIVAQCDAVDGPVNPHDIKALTCGNFETYLAEDFQRTYGLQPPTSAPPPPSKGAGPDGRIDSSRFSDIEPKCSPGGVVAPDKVAEVINKIVASSQPLPSDVIRVAAGTQVNMTAFPEGRHTFDIYEKGREDQPWGDLMLYNLALVPTLQAISMHLSMELAQGRFGSGIDALAPATGSEKRISQGHDYPRSVLSVLYYLDRIIEELNSSKLNVAWGDLSELGSLSYYHAPTRTVILDQSLRADLNRVLTLATPYTEDPDIQGLANVSRVIGPLVHAATHHILLEDDLTIHSQRPPAADSFAPIMSIMPQPSSAAGGEWTPMPEEESPCRGLFFKIDRSRCEFDTGYLDADTCVPQKVGGGAKEILQGETLSRFVSLVAEYYLPQLETTKLKMMCSLGEYIATCNNQVDPSQGGELCLEHRPGVTNPISCTRHFTEQQRLPECPTWANEIPDRNRTWIECHNDPRGPEICVFNENGLSRHCTRDGQSEYPPCRVDASGVVYDSSGSPARSYSCERRSTQAARCRNPACQQLSTTGTCQNQKTDYSSFGILDGLVCDKNSGGLLGATFANGNVVSLRPENYFTPAETMHNFLIQGRADEAMTWAGRMVFYRDWIPHPPPPTNFLGNIQSLQ